MSILPMFSDVDLWDGGIGGLRNQWSTVVRLPGFRRKDVTIDRSDDLMTIRVVARRASDNGDYSETQRTVSIPSDVEAEMVQMDFVRDGVLVIKAPYKVRPLSMQTPSGLMSEFGWPLVTSGWGGLTSEMRNLQEEMNRVAASSFPGFLEPVRYVQRDSDGHYGIEMDFNVQGYRPEEIKIDFDQKKNSVTVEAKHETKKDDEHSYKHLKRQFILPNGVMSKEMTSKLLENGYLRLEAPCVIKDAPKPLTKTETVMPITRK